MQSPAYVSGKLPEISVAEIAAVNVHLRSLVDAINATAPHRDVHTGIMIHGLLLNLSREEQAVALSYLQSQVFWKLEFWTRN